MLGSSSSYKAPSWAGALQAPSSRVHLSCLPSPIHPLNLSLSPAPMGISPSDLPQIFIKRDDMSAGVELGGNKVRKLEFLMAEAQSLGADSVITIGGIQSNHCRATTAAARMVGLETHLILRTSKALLDQDPGFVGNLLPERLSGAHLHVVSKEDYTRLGSEALTAALAHKLESLGKKPYVIPVGGSNATGTWGYLQFIEELLQQQRSLGMPKITDLVVASGSGGTTAGIALGNYLSGAGIRIWSYGVCDTPEYFYDHVDKIYRDMGFAEKSSRELFTALQAKGRGYAINTEAELQFVKAVASSTGVVLDPVYSGKALFSFMKQVKEEVSSGVGSWRDRTVLFVHTGGGLGLFDKVSELKDDELAGRVSALSLEL